MTRATKRKAQARGAQPFERERAASGASSLASPRPAKRGDRERAPVHVGGAGMSCVTRDLRITGVTKRGSSWQYHIEALDIRANGGTVLPVAAASTPPAVHNGAGCYQELPPMVRYTVLRRYNDFRQLYVYLVDTFGNGVRDMLPEFPDGGWLSFIRGGDPKLLQYRREKLQEFLRAVDAHDVLKWCDAFTHFLRPDVREITTIGDAFKASVENHESLNNLSVGRVNSTGGYVSLSYLKSPEIRFNHSHKTSAPPKSAPVRRSDARGDSKRRRVALANLYEDPNKAKRKESITASIYKPNAGDAALNTGSTTASGESIESDSDDDGNSSSFGSRGVLSLRQQTEVLRLLSLEPEGSKAKKRASE